MSINVSPMVGVPSSMLDPPEQVVCLAPVFQTASEGAALAPRVSARTVTRSSSAQVEGVEAGQAGQADQAVHPPERAKIANIPAQAEGGVR